MIISLRHCLFVPIAFLFLGIAAGCAGKQNQPSTTGTLGQNQGPKGPDYQVFAPLPQIALKATLPLLLGPEGEDETSCFVPLPDLVPEPPSGIEIKHLVEKHSAAVDKVFRDWFVNDLAPVGLSQGLAARWEITPEEIMVISVDDDAVKFADDQSCIDSDSGWLPQGTHPVTMLIGAKTIQFKSQLPLDSEIQEEIMRSVGAENIVLESPSLFVYEPVFDENGQQKANADGVPLVVAPDGTYITEDQIPDPTTRKMTDWTLKSETPIYFAFRELPTSAYRRESDKDLCDVFLVWGDIVPRKPECDEYTESGFTAAKTEDGQVALTITTEQSNKGITLGFGEGKMVQVDERIILWLSPKKIEEGVLLRVNSLVLNPKTVAGTSSVPTRETYVPVRPEEPSSQGVEPDGQPESESEPAPKPRKDKKKKKEKDKKPANPVSDEENIDAFLNN